MSQPIPLSEAIAKALNPKTSLGEDELRVIDDALSFAIASGWAPPGELQDAVEAFEAIGLRLDDARRQALYLNLRQDRARSMTSETPVVARREDVLEDLSRNSRPR